MKYLYLTAQCDSCDCEIYEEVTLPADPTDDEDNAWFVVCPYCGIDVCGELTEID